MHRPMRRIRIQPIKDLALLDRVQEVLPRDGRLCRRVELRSGRARRDGRRGGFVQAHREGVLRGQVSSQDSELVELPRRRFVGQLPPAFEKEKFGRTCFFASSRSSALTATSATEGAGFGWAATFASHAATISRHAE